MVDQESLLSEINWENLLMPIAAEAAFQEAKARGFHHSRKVFMRMVRWSVYRTLN